MLEIRDIYSSFLVSGSSVQSPLVFCDPTDLLIFVLSFKLPIVNIGMCRYTERTYFQMTDLNLNHCFSIINFNPHRFIAPVEETKLEYERMQTSISSGN